jgi:lambda family phage portal protein
MVKLYILDQYDDAELDRKKTAAMFAGFVTSEPGDNVFDEEEEGLLPLEPGLLQLLNPGQDIKFSEPADVGSNYEAFQRRVLLAASSAMRIPYHMVTNDVSGANYSSLRASLVDYRRRIGQMQYATIIHQFMRPVWGAFIEGLWLSGKLKVDAKEVDAIKAANFIPPKWDWVDPLKDISAAILEMKHGITSRRKVVESKGSDIEEIDNEVAQDIARAKELGIQFGDQGAISININYSEGNNNETNLV